MLCPVVKKGIFMPLCYSILLRYMYIHLLKTKNTLITLDILKIHILIITMQIVFSLDFLVIFWNSLLWFFDESLARLENDWNGVNRLKLISPCCFFSSSNNGLYIYSNQERNRPRNIPNPQGKVTWYRGSGVFELSLRWDDKRTLL